MAKKERREESVVKKGRKEGKKKGRRAYSIRVQRYKKVDILEYRGYRALIKDTPARSMEETHAGRMNNEATQNICIPSNYFS